MPDHEKGGRTVGTGPDEAGEMDMATMDNNTDFDSIVNTFLQLIGKRHCGVGSESLLSNFHLH